VDEENKVSYNDFKKLLRGKLADADIDDIDDIKTLDTFLSEIGKVIESK